MNELLLRADRLLTVDMLDQAEALYRVASEQDPGDAYAVVGMARCEVERRHDRAAYDLAVRALRIDPDNGTARRLEARLAEVLAGRGEPVTRPDFVLRTSAAPGSTGQGSLSRSEGTRRRRRSGILDRILGR